jgi:hypothetical protein
MAKQAMDLRAAMGGFCEPANGEMVRSKFCQINVAMTVLSGGVNARLEMFDQG